MEIAPAIEAARELLAIIHADGANIKLSGQRLRARR